MSSPGPWWEPAVIYQVYPRSWQDTNADGIGDLAGITARLDYLVVLGVDALWISPFYPSPMADFGYDVADYTGVDPIFGTLADFDTLIAAAHARSLKLILDFVPNHTSDRHPWFAESCSSRTNPKRDWYLWRDPAPAGSDTVPASRRPPNNWMSHFGGPAWTWHGPTQQFYCHSFLPQQPDLNWRNPEVRAAMYAAMRFWLERGPEGKGVDGFRMDVLWLLIKDAQFRDNPPNPDWRPADHSFYSVLPLHNADQPETHAIVREMRALMDTYPGDRLLIGEIYLPLFDLVRYYGAPPQLDEVHLPFNFLLIQTPWRAETVAAIIRDYEQLLPTGAWPNYVLGNHDQSRLATRIGAAQARVAAMLLLTLRGTPTLYYGDELGMEDISISAAEVQDPAEKNEPGKGKGRDPERSPMLWDTSANAGFTMPSATPWLPVSPQRGSVNVAVQGAAPRSMLSLYRALLHLRRAHPALHSGSIAEVAARNGVLTYTRIHARQRLQIHLNLSGYEQQVPTHAGRVLFTTLMDGAGAEVAGTLTLEADEGILLELS